MKWKSPTKTGKNCPARVVTRNIDGRLCVHYQRTHVGNTQTIRYLRLTKKERDKLANKITFNRILTQLSLKVV